MRHRWPPRNTIIRTRSRPGDFCEHRGNRRLWWLEYDREVMDAHRIAAADMWGSSGSLRRRRIIRAEFLVGVAGCLVLGVLCLVRGEGWVVIVGVWLVGAGANYVPLALHANSLMRPGALERELAGTDLRRELRRAGVHQLWIAVPFALAIQTLTRRRS